MTKRRGNKEGTVYERPNGKWRAQIVLEGRRLSYTAASKAQALEWLRSISYRVDTGLTYASHQMTLGQLLDEWLAARKPNLAEHTAYYYEQVMREYILPVLGNTPLRKLSPGQIQRLYTAKVQEGVGLRTVQKTHTILHAALNYALKMGMIERNPSKGAQSPKPQPAEMQFLAAEEAQVLLKTAKGNCDPYYAIYYLAIVTGMRQGELLGLKWQDIDFDHGVLNVRRSLKRRPKGDLYLSTPKTKSSIRAIKLGEQSIQVLREHQEALEKVKAEADSRWQVTGHVFVSSIGTAIDPANLLKRFRQLLRLAGLPKIRFHDLRHTAASLMLNNGVDVLVASQRLGHAKPSITLNVYGHLIPAIQHQAAETLDRLISS